MITKHIGCSYLESATRMEVWQIVVQELALQIEKSGIDFDTIVFRGISGSLIAPAVAAIIGKEILVVRKGESCHSSYDVEGNSDVKRYIIIDDLISSGGTIRSIFKKLLCTFGKSECVGIFLYHSSMTCKETFEFEHNGQLHKIIVPVRGFYVKNMPSHPRDYTLISNDGQKQLTIPAKPARMSLMKRKLLSMFCGLMIIGGCHCSCNAAPLTEPQVNTIADAIYRVEGADKAKVPYGILSKHVANKDDARRVCCNTIRNNFIRWQKAGKPNDFIQFLGARYAPVGAMNDPRNLNSNWVKNLKSILNNKIKFE